MRQSPSEFKMVAIPAFEFGHGMFVEEFRSDALACYLPSRRFRTILAKFEDLGSAGLAQAQLTQAKPSGLFCFNRTSGPRNGT
jgi:hypothetical protein